MFRQQSREGYLLVDHRFSPGLDEGNARLNGYDPQLVSEGKLLEAATLTCAHCNVNVIKRPDRLRERGFCQACFHYICDACAFKASQPAYVHQPFKKVVDDTLERNLNPQLGSPPKLILP